MTDDEARARHESLVYPIRNRHGDDANRHRAGADHLTVDSTFEFGGLLLAIFFVLSSVAVTFILAPDLNGP